MCSKKLLENEKYLYLIRKEDGEEIKPFKFVETITRNFLVIFLTSSMTPNEGIQSVTKSYHIV